MSDLHLLQGSYLEPVQTDSKKAGTSNSASPPWQGHPGRLAIESPRPVGRAILPAVVVPPRALLFRRMMEKRRYVSS